MKLRKRYMMLITICLALAASLCLAQQEDAGDPGIEALGPGGDAPTVEPAPGTLEGDQPADEEEQKPDNDKNRRQPGFDQNFVIIMMVGVLVLFYVLAGRGRKKREAKHREMLAGLKKGDKVTSIGGICGTIMEVREDEITVKVDEANNVRMKFARWAIRGVGDTGKAESPDQEQKK